MATYAWTKTIRTMAGLMAAAKIPCTEEQFQEINQFYLTNSPKELEVIPDDLVASTIPFQKKAVGNAPQTDRPQITSIEFTDLDGDGKENDIIVTDNISSGVTWLRSTGLLWQETTLAEAPAPVNTAPVDIDQDGDMDLAVSAMGFMHPNDELIGEFHLLINEGNGRSFTKKQLLKGTPRITDCAPGDYDGDGDLDFIIAMFGWRSTGSIGLLRQTAPMEFELENIIDVNGCMRVLKNDGNGDGKADFVAMITQQHEAIVQFTNDGSGKFVNSLITKANHPSFGSSSLVLADLDQDGDEDILYTNGDMMDENPAPKPYHGVRWLERKDDGGYDLHYLAGMPGCYCAKPFDMDGDGDLDVVYSALYFHWNEADFPSLAWLENTDGKFREFTKRKIAYAPSNLAIFNIGDANGDGKPDIIAGGMHVPGPIERAARLTAWISQPEKQASN